MLRKSAAIATIAIVALLALDLAVWTNTKLLFADAAAAARTTSENARLERVSKVQTTTTTISPNRAPIFREVERHESEQSEGFNKDSRTSQRDGSDKEDAAAAAAAAALSAVQLRLMKELRKFRNSGSYKQGFFDVELGAGDNLQEWNVKIFFPKDARLFEDLQELKDMGKGEDHIMIEVTFNENFPTQPPFARIVYPNLKGSIINAGGSICMDLLTKYGWDNAYTLEAFMLMIQSALQEMKVRVDFERITEKGRYSRERAREGFAKLEDIHDQYGW